MGCVYAAGDRIGVEGKGEGGKSAPARELRATDKKDDNGG